MGGLITITFEALKNGKKTILALKLSSLLRVKANFFFIGDNNQVKMSTKFFPGHFHVSIFPKTSPLNTSGIAQKIEFSLTISSVNVTKYAGTCGFSHIY